MKTAVIYARVSSANDRQDTTRQIEDLKRFANSQNIEVISIFEEHISGAKKNEERQVLTDCLQFCIKRMWITYCYLNFPDLAEARYKCLNLWICYMNPRYQYIYRI